MKGRYILKHPEKYKGNPERIVYRSSWERLCMIWMDFNPSILKWNSEGVRIPYICATDGRVHKYHVDFWIQVKTKDGKLKEALLEVKPESETVPPIRKRQRDDVWRNQCLTWLKNQSKWEAARQFCRERSIDFYIITEKTLKIGKYSPKKKR